MSAQVLNPDLGGELDQGLRVSALLSVGVHLFFWASCLLGMTYIVPNVEMVFEVFGGELTSSWILIVDFTRLPMQLFQHWPLGLYLIVAVAIADWWVLVYLARLSAKSLAYLWFWGNVAAPVIVAVVVAAVVTTTLTQVTTDMH